jgi:amino acid permease
MKFFILILKIICLILFIGLVFRLIAGNISKDPKVLIRWAKRCQSEGMWAQFDQREGGTIIRCCPDKFACWGYEEVQKKELFWFE